MWNALYSILKSSLVMFFFLKLNAINDQLGCSWISGKRHIVYIAQSQQHLHIRFVRVSV